jgi:trehalose utilization protein
MSRALLTIVMLVSGGPAIAADPVRVLVWDEQQPAQKQAYDNFLGNAIAAHLKSRPDFDVRSVKLDDPEQGLSDDNLEFAQVLVWWGHVRQREVTPETGQKIVQRIKDGKLSLIALHSAHWSTPFVQAMYERTRMDAAKRFPETAERKVTFEFVPPPFEFTVPAHESIRTPAYYVVKRGPRDLHVRVDLPNCCFPDYRPDGAPSTMIVLDPHHPAAAGLPAMFKIPHTEMYNDPFHVPEPDETVFEETWEKGERFRSGLVWNIGRGKVFYWRPGHETFDVYHQPEPLRVVENAARWLAKELPATEK